MHTNFPSNEKNYSKNYQKFVLNTRLNLNDIFINDFKIYCNRFTNKKGIIIL